jgi:hypothetical protein
MDIKEAMDTNTTEKQDQMGGRRLVNGGEVEETTHEDNAEEVWLC